MVDFVIIYRKHKQTRKEEGKVKKFEKNVSKTEPTTLYLDSGSLRYSERFFFSVFFFFFFFFFLNGFFFCFFVMFFFFFCLGFLFCFVCLFVFFFFCFFCFFCFVFFFYFFLFVCLFFVVDFLNFFCFVLFVCLIFCSFFISPLMNYFQLISTDYLYGNLAGLICLRSKQKYIGVSLSSQEF